MRADAQLLRLQGTALLPLQSCMNHSDMPNASALKGDADVDGRAVLSACKDIAAGEEVCMSYVSSDPALTDAERACVLRDYGIPG